MAMTREEVNGLLGDADRDPEYGRDLDGDGRSMSLGTTMPSRFPSTRTVNPELARKRVAEMSRLETDIMGLEADAQHIARQIRKKQSRLKYLKELD